jgi:MazG family protein
MPSKRPQTAADLHDTGDSSTAPGSRTAQGDLTPLLDLMAQLRNPNGGCPWDLEQTFASIAPHTIEEAYEVAEAIESGDRAALCDELGDLLLQVVFHSQIADEEGSFSFHDVATAIIDKMIRRHPHVFGAESITTAAAQTQAWESQKEKERASKVTRDQPASALDGVTATLPAMTRALKLQGRAARVGFDWDDAASVVGKIEEELNEVKEEFSLLTQGEDPAAIPDALQSEIGDLLFSVVNLARKAGIDPESALRSTNRKFDWRFRTMETLATTDGNTFSALPLEEMEVLWHRAKEQEKQQQKTHTPSRR